MADRKRSIELLRDSGVSICGDDDFGSYDSDPKFLRPDNWPICSALTAAVLEQRLCSDSYFHLLPLDMLRVQLLERYICSMPLPPASLPFMTPCTDDTWALRNPHFVTMMSSNEPDLNIPVSMAIGPGGTMTLFGRVMKGLGERVPVTIQRPDDYEVLCVDPVDVVLAVTSAGLAIVGGYRHHSVYFSTLGVIDLDGFYDERLDSSDMASAHFLGTGIVATRGPTTGVVLHADISKWPGRKGKTLLKLIDFDLNPPGKMSLDEVWLPEYPNMFPRDALTPDHTFHSAIFVSRNDVVLTWSCNDTYIVARLTWTDKGEGNKQADVLWCYRFFNYRLASIQLLQSSGYYERNQLLVFGRPNAGTFPDDVMTLRVMCLDNGTPKADQLVSTEIFRSLVVGHDGSMHLQRTNGSVVMGYMSGYLGFRLARPEPSRSVC
jgi:hypothetical protein